MKKNHVLSEWFRIRTVPQRPFSLHSRGFTLLSAVIGVALITGLIVFMLSLSMHFHRINRESLSGTQMEMVLDAIINAYIWQRQTSPLRRYYHITDAGILPGGEITQGHSSPIPPPQDVIWVDTVEVSIWRENIGHGIRTWGVCTSQRSRRGSITVRYAPKLD